MGLNGSTNGCCRWFFTFNNEECWNPATIEGVVASNGSVDVNDVSLNTQRVIMSKCRIKKCYKVISQTYMPLEFSVEKITFSR